MACRLPYANIGANIQKLSKRPTEPTDASTTPDTAKIPGPSRAPRFSITADISVTSCPSGLFWYIFSQRHATIRVVTSLLYGSTDGDRHIRRGAFRFIERRWPRIARGSFTWARVHWPSFPGTIVNAHSDVKSGVRARDGGVKEDAPRRARAVTASTLPDWTRRSDSSSFQLKAIFVLDHHPQHKLA